MKQNVSLLNRVVLAFSKINSYKLNKPKFKKVLTYCIIGLLFIMAYMVFALYAIRPFNYIMIAIAIIESCLIFTYVILFGSIRFNIYQALMIVFYLCQVISFAVNGFKYISKTPLLLALFGIVLSEFYSQDDIPKRLVFSIFIVAGWLFMLTFLTVEFQGIIHPKFSDRIGSVFGNENDVGRHFALVYMFNFGLIFTSFRKKWVRFLFIFPCLLAFYFVLLSGSVSNVITVLFVTIFYLFIKTPNKKKWLFANVVVVVVIFAVIALQLPVFSYFKSRIDGMFNAFDGEGRADMSFVGRWNATMNGLALFLESPIFGYGERAISFYSFIGTTHNNFTDVLCYYGIIAFIAYESLILTPIIKYFKTKEKRNESAMCVIIYTFVFQLFLYSYNFKADMMMIPFAYFMLNVDYKWNDYFAAIGFDKKKNGIHPSNIFSSISYDIIDI